MHAARVERVRPGQQSVVLVHTIQSTHATVGVRRLCCKCGCGADLEQGQHHCMSAFAYSYQAANTCTSVLSCTCRLLPTAGFQAVPKLKLAKIESVEQNRTDWNRTVPDREGLGTPHIP